MNKLIRYEGALHSTYSISTSPTNSLRCEGVIHSQHRSPDPSPPAASRSHRPSRPAAMPTAEATRNSSPPPARSSPTPLTPARTASCGPAARARGTADTSPTRPSTAAPPRTPCRRCGRTARWWARVEAPSTPCTRRPRTPPCRAGPAASGRRPRGRRRGRPSCGRRTSSAPGGGGEWGWWECTAMAG
jgi:hypothetical protein